MNKHSIKDDNERYLDFYESNESWNVELSGREKDSDFVGLKVLPYQIQFYNVIDRLLKCLDIFSNIFNHSP